MHIVTFLPRHAETRVSRGTDLLTAAAQAGVPVEGSCGGHGTCGKCNVKLIEGKHGSPDPLEVEHLSPAELAEGWVLACRRTVEQDSVVQVPAHVDVSHRKGSLKGEVLPVAAEPSVEKLAVQLEHPTVEDQTADLDRLLSRLPAPAPRISRRELGGLPRLLRQNDFSVTVALAGGRLIAVEPGDTTESNYGLAFDIGTTTVMGSLLDLNSGTLLEIAAATNPQSVHGADVISRITYASGESGLEQLHRKVIGAMNEITGSLLARAGIDPDHVYETLVVGNTTMSHLFLGIDPTYLAPAPFIPAYQRAVEAEAAELGLKTHPAGRVLALPNLAGYVGSDTVGVILATGLDLSGDATCLAVDIGTNGELVLAAKGRLLTCSTAAGPALEGAKITHGMRAAEGAIEAVHIGEELQLSVIGDVPSRGVCGSGLIDAVAELLRAGLIDTLGQFVDPEFVDPETDGRKLPAFLKERLRPGESGFEFVLAWKGHSGIREDIVLTQGDVAELQLAKGAIHAGFKILLKEAGLSVSDVDQVLLAGAFGNYIRKESALSIGLLPDLPVERITPVGNAAGDGARMALVSRSIRQRAFSLPGRVEHIELSSRPEFQDEFIDALPFSGG